MPSSGGNSCLDEQIERLKRCEYLREGEVKALCLRAREILVDESNVQRVDAPVTVSSRGVNYSSTNYDSVMKFIDKVYFYQDGRNPMIASLLHQLIY